MVADELPFDERVGGRDLSEHAAIGPWHRLSLRSIAVIDPRPHYVLDALAAESGAAILSRM
jgi:hypothetical protein